MAGNEQLASRVRDYLADAQLAMEEKRMMGGLCFMLHDKMCIGISGDRLLVRLDPARVPDALARRGCTPMTFSGRTSKSFVFIEPEGWNTAKDFDRWLTLALEFNPRAQSSKKRSRNPARS